MSSLKFNFVASCEEIQGHFPAKAPDHSYENVCQVIRKTGINYLVRENGSVERKIGRGEPNKTREK
jgi:hypothetical protein